MSPGANRYTGLQRNCTQEFTRPGMDNQDAVKYIISKLRSITTAVQIAPFVYALFYIIALVIYLFASEQIMYVLDAILYVSPIVVVMNLLESRILKLCRWHKMTCVLPLVPQVNIILDDYIYRFSVRAEIIHIAMVIAMSVLLLVAAYNVFLR